jgi:hypothetical protein
VNVVVIDPSLTLEMPVYVTFLPSTIVSPAMRASA